MGILEETICRFSVIVGTHTFLFFFATALRFFIHIYLLIAKNGLNVFPWKGNLGYVFDPTISEFSI